MTTALRATAVFLAVMLLLSSCASLKNSNTDQRLLIIRIAKNMINKQYKYGKQDPSWGFDCSGLTQYAYREAGIKIPRTSQNQYNDCRKISLSEIKPADLLFFSTNGSGASHVGIYIGNNKFIHSPSSGKRIQIVTMDNSYWQKHFYSAGTYF